MSRRLDPDLEHALEVLQRDLGRVEVLGVHPTPPRRPAPPPASAGAPAATLFDPPPPPTPPPATDPHGHIPARRRWREVLRQPGAAHSPAPPTRRTA